jgi:DNA-binding LytR/AlgR family response regulator
MLNIKAIIADSETHCVAHLESMLINLWPELIICGRAASGPEAVQLIEKQNPHLAFLEVRLPEMCGMQVARKFAGSCAIVFITEYQQYAVNAFDSGAVDYLVKPVDGERLEKAINRIKNWHLSQAAEHLITGLNKKETDYLQWIRVQRGNAVLLQSVEEVCYFKAGDKYTLVITRDGESLIKKPIKKLAQELDPDKFWQIHRGTIVNVAHISKMSRSSTGRGVVNLKECTDLLTVSRPYLNLFKQM